MDRGHDGGSTRGARHGRARGATGRHTAVVIPAFGSVTEIAAGWFNTFAVTSDHTAFGWGWNHLGELGDGTTTDRHAPTPLPALQGVGAIGPGPLHGLAA